jgi:hypothetical protein
MPWAWMSLQEMIGVTGQYITVEVLRPRANEPICGAILLTSNVRSDSAR